MYHILSLALALISIPLIAFSGTIEVVKSNECLLKFEGEIVEGDLDRLRGTLTDNNLTPDENYNGETYYETGLCLNSPGGSAFEGQLFAEYVYKIGMPTRVTSGSSCFSACAIIFMAGRTLGAEFDRVNRSLSAKGIVGFHAPFPALTRGEMLQAEEVAELFAAYRFLIASLIEFGGGRTAYGNLPTMSTSLLGEIFDMAPHEFKSIDTVEDAVLWGVRLVDIPEDIEINREMRDVACRNHLKWKVDERVSSKDYEHEVPIRQIKGSLYGWEVIYEEFDHSGEAEVYCLIPIRTETHRGISICSEDGNRGVSHGSCLDSGYANWMPWYAGLKASTPISALSEF